MALIDARDYQMDPYIEPLDDVVVIDEGLLSEALRECVDPIYRQFDTARREMLKAREKHSATVSRAFLQALIDWVGEGLDGCDHSVGICQCEALGLHAELKLAINGELTCPECKGEGFVWDAEVHRAAVAEARARRGEDPYEDLSDCGNVKCPTCESSGVVRREKA